MRFASCTKDGRRFAALVEREQLLPLAAVGELGRATGSDVLSDPPLDPAAQPVPLSEVTLLPVVPNPGKVICLGLNYLTHVEEMKRDLPTYPVLFTKFPEALVGAGAPIVLPPEAEQPDYEAELAIVIGRAVRRVSKENALEAIAGYTAANDVTMRDYQYRTHQWLQGKSWSRSTPLGPYLVTPDEVGDPGALDIALTLNGRELQRSNTSRLIFDVATIVSTLSEFVTLEPGDVILSGTPGGVGVKRDPQVFLEPGDTVRVEIEKVGALENPVVAEATAPTPTHA